jgi:hypothetical protein
VADVTLRLSNPIGARYAAPLGLEVKDYATNDEVTVDRQTARAIIGAGYAQVDPEDTSAVNEALGIDSPSRVVAGRTDEDEAAFLADRNPPESLPDPRAGGVTDNRVLDVEPGSGTGTDGAEPTASDGQDSRTPVADANAAEDVAATKAAQAEDSSATQGTGTGKASGKGARS